MGRTNVHKLWGSLDFKWYPEASYSSEKNGYQGVRAFITPNDAPMGYTGNDGDPQTMMSVKDFVNGIAPVGRLTPPDVADLLKRYANTGLATTGSRNREFQHRSPPECVCPCDGMHSFPRLVLAPLSRVSPDDTSLHVLRQRGVL